MKERSFAAPVVMLLMLLPLIYVGSYFALVTPGKYVRVNSPITAYQAKDYRAGKSIANVLFWPLEQIDRKARPSRWEMWTPGVPE